MGSAARFTIAMWNNNSANNAIDDILDSSFVTWSTQCLVDFGANITVADTAAHTAADDAARYLSDHGDTTWTVFAIASIVVGILLTFLGYEVFYLTFGIIAFLSASVFCFGLLCGASNSLAAAIACGVLAGALATFLCVKFPKIGAAVCGAVGGLISYMYLNAFVLTHLYTAVPEAHQSWTPALFATLLCIVGAGLALCFERYLIIASTSLGGAYPIGFAVDRLIFKAADHDLNPLVLVAGGGCRSGECYGILVGIVVLALIGAYVQLRRTADDKHHEGEPGHLRRFSKEMNPVGYEVADMAYTDHTTVEQSILQGENQRRVSREMMV